MKRPPHRQNIRTLVCISDTHGGCRMGLYPLQRMRIDDGGWYHPSEFQEQMWALWRSFWDEWVPTVTRGEPYHILHNGDAMDGSHHGAKTQISQNVDDQLRICEAFLKPEIDKCHKMGGSYYHVRGTEAHVGKSAEHEELLARHLGAKPDSKGQYSRWVLRTRIGDCLIHATHHIGTTGSAAYESSAVNSEIAAHLTDSARWNRPHADMLIRGHRHRSIAVELDTDRGYLVGMVLPGWQGRTPFAYRIPGARVSEPQFGGAIVRHGDEEFYWRRKVWGVGGEAEE